MLAVTTTDSRIPRPYYDLYARLADDLDETSARISALTKQIKVRGAYNARLPDIADLLHRRRRQDDPGRWRRPDQRRPPEPHLDGADRPIPCRRCRKLYLARDQIKQSIYEIMGISDIMRGATKASETATAQRIKGSMGVSRLEDQKQAAGNFVRDLLRLKAEIICQNFDAETLEAMTGEAVTPDVEAILRDDLPADVHHRHREPTAPSSSTSRSSRRR